MELIAMNRMNFMGKNNTELQRWYWFLAPETALKSNFDVRVSGSRILLCGSDG